MASARNLEPQIPTKISAPVVTLIIALVTTGVGLAIL
jgi:hypothetical protein